MVSKQVQVKCTCIADTEMVRAKLFTDYHFTDLSPGFLTRKMPVEMPKLPEKFSEILGDFYKLILPGVSPSPSSAVIPIPFRSLIGNILASMAIFLTAAAIQISLEKSLSARLVSSNFLG